MRLLKVKVKKKKLTQSSRRWLERQLNDPFVSKAKADGYRSRAAYKLIEINQKYKIFKKGQLVIDLGAAPGGWSQVSHNFVGDKGDVKAIDLLPFDPIPGVTIFQGDFNDITSQMSDKVDVILSDMAPSTCGIKSVDHIRIMGMLEEVFAFAKEWLKPEGVLIAKVFRGGTETALLNELKLAFKKINHFKPESSRKESTEFYLIAQGFRL